MKKNTDESRFPGRTHPAGEPPPASWGETLWGAGLFLVIGALFVMEEIPVDWIAPERIPFRLPVIWACVILPPLGVAIGWVLGFPRWSYAYLGAVLVSYYLASTNNPYLSLFGVPLFGSELPGERAWIPFLLACGVGLLATRSFRPLAMIPKRLNNDLTVITYTFFGLMPLFAWVSFDEIDRLYSLPWLTVLTLLEIGTAAIYLRSRSQRGRVFSISAGVLLCLVTLTVGPALYQVGWVDLDLAILYGIIIAVILLLPAFFALAQPAANPGQV